MSNVIITESRLFMENVRLIEGRLEDGYVKLKALLKRATTYQGQHPKISLGSLTLEVLKKTLSESWILFKQAQVKIKEIHGIGIQNKTDPLPGASDFYWAYTGCTIVYQALAEKHLHYGEELWLQREACKRAESLVVKLSDALKSKATGPYIEHYQA